MYFFEPKIKEHDGSLNREKQSLEILALRFCSITLSEQPHINVSSFYNKIWLIQKVRLCGPDLANFTYDIG